MELVNIRFEDLKPEAQERVLAFFGTERPKDLNLLKPPLFVLDEKFKVELINRIIESDDDQLDFCEGRSVWPQ